MAVTSLHLVEDVAASQPRPVVRPTPGRAVVSIRWIVTAAAVLLTAAAVLSVGFVHERNARAALTGEIQARLLLQARSLAAGSASALLGDFPELTLHPLVRGILTDQPELAFAVVVDHRGVIQGHANPRMLGARYVDPAGLKAMPAPHIMGEGEWLRQNRSLLVAESPVRQGDGRAIGRAQVGLPRGYLDRALASSRRQQLWALGVFVVLGTVAAFVLMSQLLRPVVALRAGIQRIAGGDLETPIQLRDRTELGLLADAVNDMAGALRRAQAEVVERARLAHEVELARQIQRSLLPSAPLAACEFDIRGHQRAAAEVGGDYYDVLRLADGRIGLAIADVAGKGLAGCLVMAMVSALLRALRNTHHSPAAMLAALDDHLAETLRPGTFVTMFYGVLEPDSGQLTWASAGHNPGLLFRAATGQVECLESKGIPIGALRGGVLRTTLRDHRLTLAPGDVFVQYTDGCSEALAATGEERFGIERISGQVADHAPQGAEAVLQGLHATLDRWTGGRALEDDDTLLVVGRAPAGARPPHGDRVAGAAPASTAAALEWLAEAERRGAMLTLQTRLDNYEAIHEWAGRVPVLRDLEGQEAEWLRAALYEACTNVAEHGYGQVAGRSFQLWWVPASDPPDADGTPPTAEEAALRVRAGRFVLRDDGAPFSPGDWKETDFADRGQWKRGRGLGLDIIHRVMRVAAYHPGTARGNITVMAFGPGPTPIPRGAAR